MPPSPTRASCSATSTPRTSSAARRGWTARRRWAALTRLGDALGTDAVRAAEGVHRVVNTQMAEGIRLATVRRGVDPRRFALLGFGGAAGLQVTELARIVHIGRIILPRVASVLSAWGMLSTELRLEAIRSHISETGGAGRRRAAGGVRRSRGRWQGSHG